MGKVHVHCCESVAENDTSGLVAEGFSGLTELLLFQGTGVGGVCSHAPFTRTRAHVHRHTSSLGAVQHFFLPVGR